MGIERGMTGAEVREVFGSKEVLELEELEKGLLITIDSIKLKLKEEWNADLQIRLLEVIDEFKGVQNKLRILDKKFTQTNKEAKEVGAI